MWNYNLTFLLANFSLLFCMGGNNGKRCKNQHLQWLQIFNSKVAGFIKNIVYFCSNEKKRFIYEENNWGNFLVKLKWVIFVFYIKIHVCVKRSNLGVKRAIYIFWECKFFNCANSYELKVHKIVLLDRILFSDGFTWIGIDCRKLYLERCKLRRSNVDAFIQNWYFFSRLVIK